MFKTQRSSLRKTLRFAPPSLEVLENRALLASNVFIPPDLTPYITAASHGVNSGPATIQKMVSSLETQLTSGPLADLNAGTDTPDVFATDVASLIASFQSNVQTQLSPKFPNITNILTLEGTQVESQLSVLGTQVSLGLLTTAQFPASAATAINSLTAGPLLSLHTPLSGYVTATKYYESQLTALIPTLATGATPVLTLPQLVQVVDAGSQAYSNATAAALYVHPKVNQTVDKAVNTLMTTVSGITSTGTTTPAAQLTAAVTAFDTAILDTTGLFGPQGVVAKYVN